MLDSADEIERILLKPRLWTRRQNLRSKGFVALDIRLGALRTKLVGQPNSCLSENAAKQLMREGTSRKNDIGAAPVLGLNTLNFPMIQKNNQRLYSAARNQIN